MSQIYVLHYDGVVTGSVELRLHNQHVVSKMYSRNHVNSGAQQILDYFEKYDNSIGGKKNEPFFDAFIVHMAFANANSDVSYEGNHYYPIDTSNDLMFPNKGPSSVFRTSNYDKDNRIESIPDYENSDHVFILSPLSEDALKDLVNIIDTRVRNLIFHIQGDAILASGNQPKNYPPESGMKGNPTGGLFGEAFNMYSGGIEFQQFREKLRSENAMFYSVSPRVNNISQEFASWKEEDDLSVPVPIPDYYTRVVDDLLNALEYGNTKTSADSFKRLTVKRVYQDGVDKDNLGSLVLLSKLTNQLNIPCMFMGLRLYSSTTRPFGHQLKSSMWLRGPGKPDGTNNGFRINPVTGEAEKPPDIRGPQHGNIEFKLMETIDFYKHQSESFKNIMNDFAPGKFQFLSGGIVDGAGQVSNSLRAPFNFALFYFAKNTYMDYGAGANGGSSLKGIDQQYSLNPVGGSNITYDEIDNNMTGGSKDSEDELIPLVNNL